MCQFIKLFRMFLLGGVVLFSSACQSDTNWNGTYEYMINSGNTVGGSVITAKYVLSINDSSCNLDIDGYQLEERIICNAESKNNVLSIKFKSYANGSSLNDFGVAIYKVNDILFNLRKFNDSLVTKWIAETPDNIDIKEGNYFKLK